MQIDFYEEYPTKENLEKLKLINYPIRLFVAAHSLDEFKKLEKKVKQIKKDVQVAYWPIIPNSYYISPFSNARDLKQLFNELSSIKNPLLIDIELPIPKRKIIQNLFHFSKNKKLINNFLDNNKKRVTTAEFPVSTLSYFMKILGLDYKLQIEKSLMWYSSVMPKPINKNIKKHLKKLKVKENYSISLGTIATGVLGNEPILSPKNLENDLEFVKQAGFKKVIIFRLGGLNKDYIKVINKFTDEGKLTVKKP